MLASRPDLRLYLAWDSQMLIIFECRSSSFKEWNAPLVYKSEVLPKLFEIVRYMIKDLLQGTDKSMRRMNCGRRDRYPEYRLEKQ